MQSRVVALTPHTFRWPGPRVRCSRTKMSNMPFEYPRPIVMCSIWFWLLSNDKVVGAKVGVETKHVKYIYLFILDVMKMSVSFKLYEFILNIKTINIEKQINSI